MTINFRHLRIPRSPVTVAVSHHDVDQQSWKAEEQLQQKKRVGFCPQVRVYRRFVDEEEAVTPPSELYYTRSEFIEIKREIREMKQIYDKEQSCAHSFQHLVNNLHYCLRGVEHMISPELKRQTEKRRHRVWYLVADLQEHYFYDGVAENDSISSSLSSEDMSHNSSSKSGFNGDVLSSMLRSETEQSAIEAARRGQEDAEAAFAEYGTGIYAPTSYGMAPTRRRTSSTSRRSPINIPSPRPRSILKRSPSKLDRIQSPLTMPFK